MYISAVTFVLNFIVLNEISNEFVILHLNSEVFKVVESAHLMSFMKLFW